MTGKKFRMHIPLLCATLCSSLWLASGATGLAITWYLVPEDEASTRSESHMQEDRDSSDGESGQTRESGPDLWQSRLDAINKRSGIYLWKTKKNHWLFGETSIRMNTVSIESPHGDVKVRATDLELTDSRYALHDFPQSTKPEPPVRDTRMTLGEIFENLQYIDGRIVRIAFRFNGDESGKQVEEALWQYQYGRSAARPALLHIPYEAKMAWAELKEADFDDGIYARVEKTLLRNEYGATVPGINLTAVGRRIDNEEYRW